MPPSHFDAWVLAEVQGMPVDLDRPLPSEPATLARAVAAGVDVALECTVHRLAKAFEMRLPGGTVRYPAGTLVLHDGQEMVFVERCGSEAGGQRPTPPPG